MSQLIQCPSCGTRLTLPPNCINCVARCGLCNARFRVSERTLVRDEDVVDWLKEGLFQHEEENDAHHPAHNSPVTHEMDPPSSGATSILPALNERIRLVKVDGHGALFEFAASRLEETDFRCAMPRRCLQCGGRTHLRAHLIVYTSQLRDSISLEEEHAAGTLILSDDAMFRMTPQALLDKLPKVPNVPHPGNLPMPYWICDMCSGTGVLSAQIQVNSETGAGLCRLLIHNIRRGMEFLGPAGGEQSKSWFELQNRVLATAENPWDTLPEAVQHRLEQWFRATRNEHFLAYVPDRDHTRTEDGMSGLAISDSRIVYHSQLRHKEAPATEPLEIGIAMAGLKGNLEVKAHTWEIKRMTVDRDGMDRLRRGLAAGHFHARWR